MVLHLVLGMLWESPEGRSGLIDGMNVLTDVVARVDCPGMEDTRVVLVLGHTAMVFASNSPHWLEGQYLESQPC